MQVLFREEVCRAICRMQDSPHPHLWAVVDYILDRDAPACLPGLVQLLLPPLQSGQLEPILRSLQLLQKMTAQLQQPKPDARGLQHWAGAVEPLLKSLPSLAQQVYLAVVAGCMSKLLSFGGLSCMLGAHALAHRVCVNRGWNVFRDGIRWPVICKGHREANVVPSPGPCNAVMRRAGKHTGSHNDNEGVVG